MHTSLKTHRCRFVLTTRSGPEEETQVSKLVLHPHMKFYREEIQLGGWLMMIRQMTMLSRCSPSGVSCCHLTHDLLLFMPGVFLDTIVWLLAQVWAPLCRSPRLQASSWRLHDILEKKKKTHCCSPEKNPPPDWVILHGRKTQTRWLLHQVRVTDDAD